VHVGRRKLDSAVVTIMEFDENSFSEKTLGESEEYSYNKNSGSVSWVNVDGLHDTDLLEKIGTAFGLHPLVMEDMLNTEQRPKIEDYGEYIYIVLKILKGSHKGGDIETDHQNIVLGNNYVITTGETGNELFESVRNRLRNGSRIRKLGADYLAYALMDSVVDDYFDILRSLAKE
jgi:magnesium transporter